MGLDIFLQHIYAELSRHAAAQGDETEAATLKEKALEIINYIANHAGSAELKAAFLATSAVQQIFNE